MTERKRHDTEGGQSAGTGGGQERGGEGQTAHGPRAVPAEGRRLDAMNTDGAGTGGVGEDAGGYGPVPGSEGEG